MSACPAFDIYLVEWPWSSYNLWRVEGSSHFVWSFPTVAAFGFLLRTRSLSYMCFLTTLLSLHFLVCSWYLLMFSTAFNIVPLIVSLEYSSSVAKACFITQRLWCMASLGSIASSPYRSLNGVKPVALDEVVLWDHTTFGNYSTHFSLRRLNYVFDTAENTIPLALSTAPFDSGW